MTPLELKYSVLGNAFTGKLCEHAGTKDFGGVKIIELSETPFDIPETWVWSTLGLCCEMYTGNSISETVKAAKYAGLETGYDYIATKDVTFNQEICYNNGVRIPYNEGFKVAYKDAILMCIEGGSAGRKIGILDRDVCFGNKLCSFHAQSIDNKYLYYYLQSWLFKELFSGNMTGIIGGVSIKKLKEISIPVAPLDEQKLIVTKIEELLPYIDCYEQAWDQLEDFNKRFPADLQKSILQMAIQGKLVLQLPEEGTGEELFQQIQAEKQALIKAGTIKNGKPLPEISDNEMPFDIPDSWKWVRLRDLCQTDISYGIIKLGSEAPDGVKVLRCSDVKENRIVPDHVRTVENYLSEQFSRTILQSGEIVINVRGTLGGCAVVPREMRGYNVAREVAVIKQWDLIDAQYIVYLLISAYFQQFMFHGLRGIAYKGLNMGTLALLPVPLPPLAEQKRIVAKLEEILPLCDRLK